MVNSAAGSTFISNSKVGDFVVVLPEAVKLVLESMVPSVIPRHDTTDTMCVMPNAAVNGLTRSTVTWLMLFWRPVVGRTEPMKGTL